MMSPLTFSPARALFFTPKRRVAKAVVISEVVAPHVANEVPFSCVVGCGREPVTTSPKWDSGSALKRGGGCKSANGYWT